MEKIKDILYDISDVLFTLIIIIFMVGVVTVKLSSAMDVNIFDSDLSTALLKGSEEVAQEKDPKTNVDNPADQDTIIIDESDAPKDSDQDTTTPPAAEVTEPVDNTPEVVEVVTDITLDIPKGSTAVSIAELLETKGIVDSSATFLSRVKELKLDPKLRYGTFKLKSNYSMDKIISVITGVEVN